MFKAQGLCAQLNLIGAVSLGLSSLVFHGVGKFMSILLVELDHIRDTGDAERGLHQWHGRDSANPSSTIQLGLIDALMHQPPFGGALTFCP